MGSGYLLYDLARNQFYKSRDVRFNEEEFPFRELNRSDQLLEIEPEDLSDETYIPDDRAERVENPIPRKPDDEEEVIGNDFISGPH